MAKTLIGIVSSNKADKTIVVTVQTSKTHPLYRKKYMVSTKFMAHDEKNEAGEGDKVAIVETRPLSARKRHTLDRVIERLTAMAHRLNTVAAEINDRKPAMAKSHIAVNVRS